MALGRVAQHVVEGLLQSIGVDTVAVLVSQHPAHGHQGIGIPARRVADGQRLVLSGANAFQSGDAGGGIRQHVVAFAVLQSSSLNIALDGGHVHVADRTRGGFDEATHAFVAAGGGANGEVDAHAGANNLTELGAPVREALGQGQGGAGAIRAGAQLDGAFLATQGLPVADGAEQHVAELLLAQLEVATVFVVADGNGASDDRDLHQTATHQVGGAGSDRTIGGAEVNFQLNQLADALSGIHRLIGDIGTVLAAQAVEPSGKHRCGEGSPGAVDLLLGDGRSSSTSSQSCDGAEGNGLLGHEHGRPKKYWVNNGDMDDLLSRS